MWYLYYIELPICKNGFPLLIMFGAFDMLIELYGYHRDIRAEPPPHGSPRDWDVSPPGEGEGGFSYRKIRTLDTLRSWTWGQVCLTPDLFAVHSVYWTQGQSFFLWGSRQWSSGALLTPCYKIVGCFVCFCPLGAESYSTWPELGVERNKAILLDFMAL